VDDGHFVGQSQFTPMIPDDDALVPYGEDSTVMIRRSVTSASYVQSVKEKSKHGQLCGCVVENKTVMTTKYHLRNSSSVRHVDAFYIDHSASSQNGGFVITTSDRRTKSVTGFSRFELSLPPAEEVDFTVEEEVVYFSHYTTVNDIKTQLKSRSVGPVIPVELRTGLERYVTRDNALTAWNRISNDHLSLSKDDIESLKVTGFQYLVGHANTLANFNHIISKLGESIALKATETATTRQILLTTNSIDTVVKNQERLRDNLDKLTEHGNSALVRRYLDDMNNDEDTLIRARQKVLDLTEEREVMREQLSVMNGVIMKCTAALVNECADIY
jgi:hypothetical protein